MDERQPMTPERLAEIRQRCEATQGPWESTCLVTSPWNIRKWRVSRGPLDDLDGIAEVYTADDAAFIAHASQDVPDLLAEVERLRGQVSQMADLMAEGDANTKRSLIETYTANYSQIRRENRRLRIALESIRRRANYYAGGTIIDFVYHSIEHTADRALRGGAWNGS